MTLLIGNWKMAPEKPLQAIDLIKKTLVIARTHKKTLSIVTCVPFVHLLPLTKVVKAPLFLGVQNVSGTVAPASTGQISAGMLKAIGISYGIVGHSEARALGEDNQLVAEKALRLLEKNIIPVICIGERERDEHGWYLSIVKDQLEAVLTKLPDSALKKIVIAYEPVWAIGANAQRTATPLECQEMVIFIRKILADYKDEKAAAKVPILYGGSVDEFNAHIFLEEGGANGLLVGRVSMEPKRFATLAASIAE
jgi:triosephosphate isomerase (TIM)